jgi:signal transduction histidine kinase
LRTAYPRGLGLGLFIVREIARAHGGTVEASSDATGTTFLIRLPPRAQSVTAEAAAASGTQAGVPVA